VIEADEPLVVDTGVPPLAGTFMAQLAEVIAPERIRWIWLTHMDSDHTGGLDLLLAAAPHARIVTSGLGAAKLGLRGIPADRVHVCNPGDILDIGGHRRHALVAVRPPCFDAPETTGLFDTRSRSLFAADSFASLLLDDGPGMDEADIAAGMLAWARVDNPWLADIDPRRLGMRLQAMAAMEPDRVLTAHLPSDWCAFEPLAAMLCDAQAAMAREDQPLPSRRSALAGGPLTWNSGAQGS
jgi:glyoxylase-like metal-dependent hydrolase (beta-lactamase superfamily II)